MYIRSVELFHFAWLKLYMIWIETFCFPFLPVPGSYNSTLCFYEFKYFRYLMFVESRQYLFFCSWFLLHLTQCPQDSCFTLEQDFLLFFMAGYYSVLCIHQSLFIYSSIDGYLNYFYLLAIVNNDAMSIKVQITSLRFLFQLFWIYTQRWDCWMICSFYF